MSDQSVLRTAGDTLTAFIVVAGFVGCAALLFTKGCAADNAPSMSNCGHACELSNQRMVSFKDENGVAECLCGVK